MPAKRAPRPPVPPPPAAEPATPPAAAPEAPAGPPDAFRRRPRQSRGQKRVELLLDAAATVIARSGLEAATAEAIALEARTAKGSLYQFFPNRDAVLAALALRFSDEMRAIHERAFPIDSHGLTLERLIDRIVKPLAEFHDRNPAFRRVFAHHDGPSDDTRSAPSRLRVQLFESFVDRLDVLFAARNPRLGTRERRRAALVAASIGQSILARRARAAAPDKKALFDDLRRILILYLEPLLDPAPATKPPDVVASGTAKRSRATSKAPGKTATKAGKGTAKPAK
ncbi:MAG TPA: TetR/AcrR family transcriptional regulator [Gemmatimonas aurantiaca]|nr:TetR/AcrR family transcriptional regulator [Gemmatimonas aurantiaca]HCT58323.1 TetR/AcrR family transcriptional regulator [Gemmatimonas aurantiaca]